MCIRDRPMTLSMLVNSLYNIVDSIFIAKISDNAMTALSLVYPIQNLITAITVGFAIGTNAVISIHLGAGNKKEADRAASLGTLLNAFHGLLLMIVCLTFIRPCLLYTSISHAKRCNTLISLYKIGILK